MATQQVNADFYWHPLQKGGEKERHEMTSEASF
jgi:hypothetical protein